MFYSEKERKDFVKLTVKSLILPVFSAIINNKLPHPQIGHEYKTNLIKKAKLTQLNKNFQDIL